MLNPAERMGQAFIGLAAALEMGGSFQPSPLDFTSSPFPLLRLFLLLSSSSLPTRVLAGARCNFQLVQCDTSKKRTWGFITVDRKIEVVWSSHTSTGGVGGGVLSTLNGHMLHISRGREQRQGGKRGRKSESTDTTFQGLLGGRRDVCTRYLASAPPPQALCAAHGAAADSILSASSIS